MTEFSTLHFVLQNNIAHHFHGLTEEQCVLHLKVIVR